MTKNIQVFLFIAVVVFCAAPASADPDIQEGLWEITTEAKMSGMQMPAQKHKQCFTKEDLIPIDSKSSQDCVIKEQAVNGNTVNWTMECNSSGVKTVATGSITYKHDSFSGKLDIVVDGMNMEIVNTMSGRRIGPCK